MVDVALEKLGRYLAPDAGKLRAKGIDSVRSRVRNLAQINPAVTVPVLAGALKRGDTLRVLAENGCVRVCKV
jgi:lipoate-protein ligase A